MKVTTNPIILMQMMREHQVLTARERRLEDDREAFLSRWEGFVPIPSAPASASILQCHKDVEFVKIEFGNQASIESFTLDTGIAESGGRIVVFDTDKVERSLASLGLLPDEDGVWLEGCLTVVDSLDSIGSAIAYLVGLSMLGDGDDSIGDAVGLLLEHLRVKHDCLAVVGSTGGWGTLDDM